MADFCNQCAAAMGFERGDFVGLADPGELVTELCEGCGPCQVDHTGDCVSGDCEINQPDTASAFAVPGGHAVHGPFLPCGACLYTAPSCGLRHAVILTAMQEGLWKRENEDG